MIPRLSAEVTKDLQQKTPQLIKNYGFFTTESI